MGLEDRTDILFLDAPDEAGIERIEIDGDDRVVILIAEPFDQTVADFAAGPGDQGHMFAHADTSALARVANAGWTVNQLPTIEAVIGISQTMRDDGLVLAVCAVLNTFRVKSQEVQVCLPARSWTKLQFKWLALIVECQLFARNPGMELEKIEPLGIVLRT
jgi:hypothetical protein